MIRLTDKIMVQLAKSVIDRVHGETHCDVWLAVYWSRCKIGQARHIAEQIIEDVTNEKLD